MLACHEWLFNTLHTYYELKQHFLKSHHNMRDNPTTTLTKSDFQMTSDTHEPHHSSNAILDNSHTTTQTTLQNINEEHVSDRNTIMNIYTTMDNIQHQFNTSNPSYHHTHLNRTIPTNKYNVTTDNHTLSPPTSHPSKNTTKPQLLLDPRLCRQTHTYNPQLQQSSPSTQKARNSIHLAPTHH